MAFHDVPLPQLLHLLPPRCGELLHDMLGRGVRVECLLDAQAPEARVYLRAHHGGQVVETPRHDLISAALVDDLVGQLEAAPLSVS